MHPHRGEGLLLQSYKNQAAFLKILVTFALNFPGRRNYACKKNHPLAVLFHLWPAIDFPSVFQFYDERHPVHARGYFYCGWDQKIGVP
jgi:hypothetical protein